MPLPSCQPLHLGAAPPLAHVLMGAGDEVPLYVAEAADRAQARAEMIDVLDQFVDGLTV